MRQDRIDAPCPILRCPRPDAGQRSLEVPWRGWVGRTWEPRKEAAGDRNAEERPVRPVLDERHARERERNAPSDQPRPRAVAALRPRCDGYSDQKQKQAKELEGARKGIRLRGKPVRQGVSHRCDPKDPAPRTTINRESVIFGREASPSASAPSSHRDRRGKMSRVRISAPAQREPRFVGALPPVDETSCSVGRSVCDQRERASRLTSRPHGR